MNKGRIISTCGSAALCIAASAVVAVAQGGSASQASPAPPRIAVTVVLQDTAAAEPAFRIVRRVRERPLDVIVLTGAADAETLSEAVRNLLMVRGATGDTATMPGQVRIRRQGSASSPALPFPWAERVVRDLRAAPPVEVSGIGTVRAVEIWLPRQHRRQTVGT